MKRFRFLAIMLSLGASFWGVFCGYFFFVGDPFYALLFFGPGYAVLVGYLFVAVFFPPSLYRRLVWGLSTIVQGAWLVLILSMLLVKGVKYADVQLPLLGWWLLAFGVSLYGLFGDHDLADKEKDFAAGKRGWTQ